MPIKHGIAKPAPDPAVFLKRVDGAVKLAAAAAAHVCAQCGGSMRDNSASPDFCGPDCQDAWYFIANGRVAVARGRVEQMRDIMNQHHGEIAAAERGEPLCSCPCVRDFVHALIPDDGLQDDVAALRSDLIIAWQARWTLLLCPLPTNWHGWVAYTNVLTWIAGQARERPRHAGVYSLSQLANAVRHQHRKLIVLWVAEVARNLLGARQAARTMAAYDMFEVVDVLGEPLPVLTEADVIMGRVGPPPPGVELAEHTALQRERLVHRLADALDVPAHLLGGPLPSVSDRGFVAQARERIMRLREALRRRNTSPPVDGETS